MWSSSSSPPWASRRCAYPRFSMLARTYTSLTQAQDVYKAKCNRLRKTHKNNTQDGLSVMVRATTFSFYPIFAIFFALLIAGTGRDFGPMLIAEEAARRLCNKRRRLASSAHLTSSSSSTHLIGEDEGITTTRYVPLIFLYETQIRTDFLSHTSITATFSCDPICCLSTRSNT